MITVPQAYITSKYAISKMANILAVERGEDALSPHVIEFEDTMNGLSGDIENLDMDLQKEIQEGCATVVSMGVTAGVTISLYESLLPREVTYVTQSRQQTAKKLYPLTTTVTVEEIAAIEEPEQEVAPVVAEEVVEEDVIDPIFAEIDATVVDNTPLAELQNDTVPYLSDAMVELARVAAANANGLQAGLTTFSHNPLETIITATKNLLIYYTVGNYANLNVALSGISSDPALNVEYKVLRESIGGPDGLSGCIAQIDFFKEHTDRLSGLVLDVNSPNDVTDNDSTDEYINVNDFSGGPNVIFRFDARYFRSAKYMIQATAAAADRGHQATELYILHDNYQAYTRVMNSMYTQDPFITFTTRLLNNNVEVLATTTEANTDFVIHGIRLRIARAAQTYGEMSQMAIIENHEKLAAYLDDGVDYVALQSASLLHPYLMGNLSREFNDMLVYLSSYSFLSMSTANKQADILSWANTLKTRRAEVQVAIETDYSNFLSCRRLAESLDIAFKLSVAYTDSTGNSIPAATLNNATIQAINAES